MLGFVVVVLWALALAPFLLAGRWVQEPGFVARAAAVVPAWLSLVPAAAIWLLANATNLLAKD